MRWFVLTATALVALAGAAYAFAGASGSPGASAYALVDPNGGSPVLIGTHTNGFTAVEVGPVGVGDYCLTPAPGVNVVSTAASASMEAFHSDAIGIASVRYPTAGLTCDAGKLEVKTWDITGAPSDLIAFTVNVP